MEAPCVFIGVIGLLCAHVSFPFVGTVWQAACFLFLASSPCSRLALCVKTVRVYAIGGCRSIWPDPCTVCQILTLKTEAFHFPSYGYVSLRTHTPRQRYCAAIRLNLTKVTFYSFWMLRVVLKWWSIQRGKVGHRLWTPACPFHSPTIRSSLLLINRLRCRLSFLSSKQG